MDKKHQTFSSPVHYKAIAPEVSMSITVQKCNLFGKTVHPYPLNQCAILRKKSAVIIVSPINEDGT